MALILNEAVAQLNHIRIVDPAGFLDLLVEGLSGAHFFGRSAERFVLERLPPKQVAA